MAGRAAKERLSAKKVAFEQKSKGRGTEHFRLEKCQQKAPKEEHGTQGVSTREARGLLTHGRTLGFTPRNKPRSMCQKLCHMVIRNRAASV